MLLAKHDTEAGILHNKWTITTSLFVCYILFSKKGKKNTKFGEEYLAKGLVCFYLEIFLEYFLLLKAFLIASISCTEGNSL
jgi:hypothetical protein